MVVDWDVFSFTFLEKYFFLQTFLKKKKENSRFFFFPRLFIAHVRDRWCGEVGLVIGGFCDMTTTCCLNTWFNFPPFRMDGSDWLNRNRCWSRGVRAIPRIRHIGDVSKAKLRDWSKKFGLTTYAWAVRFSCGAHVPFCLTLSLMV